MSAMLARTPRTVLAGFLLAAVLVLTLLPPATTPAHAASATVREAQTILNDLGYPAGPVDGIDGRQTRRGLCAWRRLEGRATHRGPLTTAELKSLRKTTRLPTASAGRGVTVDKTCQTVYYRQDSRWRKVLRASTGRSGLPKRGSYTITRKRSGWHTSSLYPASSPNMYNALYFSGAIALHGSRDVPTYPASAGCVRVTPKGADYLFARIKVGHPVRVIGAY